MTALGGSWGDVLVLCYHAISDGWPADLAISTSAFEAQTSFLARRGYRSAGFHEALTDPRPRRTVAITFDDGFRSVIERAFPILSRVGFTATVFVPTQRAGTGEPMAWPGIDDWLGTPYEPELAGMTWAELATLQEAGWEIGAHSRTHPRLTRLDDATLARELAGSRRDVEERLGARCHSVAYPYGDLDARVAAAAGAAGFSAGASLSGHLHDRGPLEWPRVGVYNGDTERRFAAKVSPRVRRLRGSPAWEYIDAIRRRLPRHAVGPSR